jgi:hypothetical protein
MLRNPIYRGERMFNRSEWVKDHATGRRRRHERPESECLREQRPDLAIVRAETFEAVQAETKRRNTRYLRGEGGGRMGGPLPGMAYRGPRRRSAFRALLGPDGRMRVYPDAERRFRVEGLFEMALETTAAARAGQTSGRRQLEVAGDRFSTGERELLRAIALPWAA